MRSKVTSKFQVTIPKDIRAKLRINIDDAIKWRIEGSKVVVEPVARPFMRHEGMVQTGERDIKADIEQARLKRAAGHK